MYGYERTHTHKIMEVVVLNANHKASAQVSKTLLGVSLASQTLYRLELAR